MNNSNLLTEKENEFNKKINEKLSDHEINEYFNEFIKNEYYRSYLINRSFVISCCMKLNQSQLVQFKDSLFSLLSKSNNKNRMGIDINEEKEKKETSMDKFSVDNENRDENYIFIINITNFLLIASQKLKSNIKNFLTDEQIILYEELYIKYSIFLSYKETIKLFAILRVEKRFSKNMMNIYQNVILDYSESKYNLERFSFVYYLLPDIVFLFNGETLYKLFNIIINDLETNQVPPEIVDSMIKKLMSNFCFDLLIKKNLFGCFYSLCNIIKNFYIEKIVTFNYIPDYVISFLLIFVLTNVNQIFISDIYDIPDKKKILLDDLIVEYIINSSTYSLITLNAALYIFMYIEVKENKIYLVHRLYKYVENKIISTVHGDEDYYYGLSCLLIIFKINKKMINKLVHKNMINIMTKNLLLEYLSLVDNYKFQLARGLHKHIIALVIFSSKVQALSYENVELLNLILPDKEFLFNVSYETGYLLLTSNKNNLDEEEEKEKQENFEEKEEIVDELVDEKEEIVDEKEEIVEVEMINNRI